MSKRYKGYLAFIVHIPVKYSETIKTESGVEIFADRRFSLKRVANTVVTVVETPYIYDGPVKNGDKVFIDPTVLMQQIYTKGGEQPNINLIDQKQGLYKVDPSMVLAYLSENSQWRGVNRNLFVKRLPMPKLKSDVLEVVDFQKTGLNDNVARRGEIIVPLSGHGCKEKDVIWFQNLYSVDVWFGDKSLTWITERYLLAIETNESAA